MKNILITGASSGFGRDTALTLAKAGHRVFAGLRDQAMRNEAVAREFTALGITPIDLDVTSDSRVETAVQTVLKATGGVLDVVINNAGIASAGVSESFATDQVQALFDVNLFGVHRVLRATLPTLRAQGKGLVITIGSILGRVTFPFFGLYGASKFALEAMIDSYGYELSQLGVEFTLVQPSAYPTNMYATVQQPRDVARASAYGETGQIPGKMFETFMGIFQGANAPDPHDVATAILGLVNADHGQRPDRVVVGQPFGADLVNSATAPVQQQVVEGLGLGHLATLPIAPKA